MISLEENVEYEIIRDDYDTYTFVSGDADGIHRVLQITFGTGTVEFNDVTNLVKDKYL